MKIKRKQKNGFLFNLLLITIFLNVFFPKAGIKISGIPLTVGNVFFGVLFIIWLIKRGRRNSLKINKAELVLLFMSFYFTVRYILSYVLGASISEIIGYVIPLIIYPLMYFVTKDLMDSDEKMEKVLKLLVVGCFFLFIYALVQYFAGIENTAIPGLTVNLSDYKTYGKYWFLEKSNGTSVSSAKIVGTYQNGNLFGINLLLIYPVVYYYLEKERKNKLLLFSMILFIIVVFLTLSRTCWLGIILFLFFTIILRNNKTKRNFYLKMIISLLSVIAIYVVFKYMPSVIDRFTSTDSKDWISMSGRTEGITGVLKSLAKSNNIVAWIIGPYKIIEFSGFSYEMFMGSLFVQTGIFGVLLTYRFFIMMYYRLRTEKNYIANACKLSLLIWLIIGLIECGYWLPPTAINLFMMLGIGATAQKNG